MASALLSPLGSRAQVLLLLPSSATSSAASLHTRAHICWRRGRRLLLPPAATLRRPFALNPDSTQQSETEEDGSPRPPQSEEDCSNGGSASNGASVEAAVEQQQQQQEEEQMKVPPGSMLEQVWARLYNIPLIRYLVLWPPWQHKKRLHHLLAEADANPKNPSKQADLLAELNKHSPQSVIERFERREHATGGQAVVEYLKALVATNGIADYLPDKRTGRSSGLPALFQELKLHAAGDLDEPFAPPGMTEQQPLHVVMVEPRSSNKSMRLIQELISAVLFMIVFSVIWIMGTAALRKYVKGPAGMGPPSNIGSNGIYSPKEFNKETMPEKNMKTFQDVKGCDEAKAELEEIVQYLRNPAKFTRLGGKLPKGVLLVGPPGTGKTLLAKAIAGEAGVPFFYRAGSEFEEMFVGVGARRVRTLFQTAKKKAPCIVFIDEIDAVGSSRKNWEGHTKKTLNQLLVEMDGFEANEGIIVLAATNLPESLDPALTRPGRFDRHVVVPNPDVRGRQDILELYLKDKPLMDDVDVKCIARGTPGFSGADLANLVNMAAVKAALDGTDKISSDQLEFAKDKILMGTERKSMVLSEESKKLTAYHESGHAVVAFNTAGANPIHKATIMPRGSSLGMVAQLPEKDETSISKIQMMARLDVCMGGRVAEELVFGPDQITSGARSDLEQATALARHMVSECGMSDTVGPMYVDSRAQHPSHEIQKSIDAEVVRLLKEAYERAKCLLRKHEDDLHALARALLENETLNASQIKEILHHHLQPQVDEDVVVAAPN
ncbi:ATP-dependent zinc metalloprotease FTSH 11, chloroplastic/mitochondrial [Selaginella moellendorffii]|uniref:ATP-dependent zinc metalloprotease FTSH 11, chloroplastic/mitochondrial n=1 Tax=Selaginella moellendorffii TaxID=88036 RepID=UPI000D1CBECB|nr:ATP-dependent zinc metalloprotease FTSH 11, chloroplastic/mitochondrial [Selaginella moellendorffii]|eukprot:XP_024534572.1 ATP-dependent zinc metalloprotease FTSH 11, chloroplastic/mitochondrial [Selaginella moellendorffii]